MPINASNLTFPHPNATSLVDFLTYGNTVTNDFFGIGILIAIFFVVFVAGKNYPTTTAFSASVMITTLASVLMALLGLVSPNIIIMLAVATIVSIFFIVSKEGTE